MSQRSFSFSIFFSLLGMGAGVTLVLFGLANVPELPRAIMHLRGLGVLFGGLLMVLCMSFSLAEVTQCLGLLWDVLTGNADPDREGVLKECVMLATRGREAEGQENKFYREVKPYLSHQLLQAGVELLIAGYSPEMIKNTLATRRDQENLNYQTSLQLLQSLMQASWMLGIAGAATALPRTELFTSRELLTIYFSGVAVPLVAGLLLAMLVFFPLMRQLQIHQREWLNYLEMSSTGVLLLQARHHALYLETVLKAYLPILPPAAPMPAAVNMPPGAAPVRQPTSNFQEALKHEVPEVLEEDPQQALSVDELRRFRPIQKPGQPQRQRPGDRPKA